MNLRTACVVSWVTTVASLRAAALCAGQPGTRSRLCASAPADPPSWASVLAAHDGRWMQEALKLAQLGGAATAPNPQVGCIIVGADGEAIGRGYHPRAGAPHAEIYALRDAGVTVEREAEDAPYWSVDTGDVNLAGATAYVTLEPCSHVGRTPPCCDAFIAAGVGRVVVGMSDPAPWVAGQGVERLRSAGIRVSVGVEEAACAEINAAWIAGVLKLPEDSSDPTTRPPAAKTRSSGDAQMSAASSTPNAEYFAELEAMAGVYSFSHPGGEFEVHLRHKGRFWAPKFQCKSTWQLESDGSLSINFVQYGKYALERMQDESWRSRFGQSSDWSGSAVGKPDSWRTMVKQRSFSTAERALMDSRWEFEHAGGSFEVEFRADAFNHFVCEKFPAHSHWRLENAETATPTVYVNWGPYGEYELEIAADGSSASGSVKGRPEDWRKMKKLGSLGSNQKVFAEHDH